MAEIQPSDEVISTFNTQEDKEHKNKQQNCQSKLKQVGQNLYNSIDVFKQSYTFLFQGKNTFGSMLGGIIVAIIWVVAISTAGHPFKQSYVTSVDMMDEIVYNYTSQKHPFGVSIILPEGADPIYNNLTVSFGCKQSTYQDSVYLIQNYSVPCQLGDHCAPPGLQCPLYSYSNKDQGALIISVSACESLYDPACDISFLNIVQYVNISVSYYTDQISFTQPVFNRILTSKNVSIPYFSTGVIIQSMQVDYFNTNTYFMGLFGFGTKKLLSLRYGQKFSTTTQVKSGYYGVSEGDALFSYIFRVLPGSKHFTHNFPNINLWVAEITSFISLVSLFFGFILEYYQKNIFSLTVSNYLIYIPDKKGKTTNLSESSFKTILAGLLYKPFLMNCYPKCIIDYFKNHFDAIQYGRQKLDLDNFMKCCKRIFNKQTKATTWVLSETSYEENQNQDQKQPQKIRKKLKQYLQQQSCFDQVERTAFLYWIDINNFQLQSAKIAHDIISKYKKREEQEQEQDNQPMISFIVNCWERFRINVFGFPYAPAFSFEQNSKNSSQIIINNNSERFSQNDSL